MQDNRLQTIDDKPMHIRIAKDQKDPVVISSSGTYVVELVEAGAQAHIVGVFDTKADEQIDIHLTIHHKSRSTRAQTMLKGVARGSARIRFFGRIVIDEGCPDTQSFLEERILLLSPTAVAEAVPELEILSDDVKCSHAASISNIPENELHYLMSRGISKQSAENMIVKGFLYVPNL